MKAFSDFIRRIEIKHLKIVFFLFILTVCLILQTDKAISATPPLLPFNTTGDLYILDNGSDSILRITPAGVITIEVTAAQIMFVTSETDVSFSNRGIVFDAAGAMYFTENSSDSILKVATSGTLTVLTSEANIVAITNEAGADPEGPHLW